MSSLKVNLPSYPKGEEISLGGLPPVENGKSIQLSDADLEAFQARHGMTVAQAFKKRKGVTFSGNQATKKQSSKRSTVKREQTPSTSADKEGGT